MLGSRVALLCFKSIARCLPVSRSRLKSLRPSRFAISRGFASRTTSQLKKMSMSISTSPSPVAAPELTDQREEVELLPAVNDYYGGVIVEMKAPMDSGAFASSLRSSISIWRKQGIKGVWIKLPINLANLVQPAVEEGFWYHHAEPSYLMLVYWIPDTKHTIPANASHRVGVGGFVMNDKREVLVVQENSGRFHGSGVWKFPTGVVDQGEDIYAAAIREVKEETGIDTEFVEILAFRQSHMSFFEKSDLFFVCMLRPLSSDIQKQESEIEAAQWMPIEEYAAQPFFQKYDMLKYINDVSLAKVERGYAGFSPVCIKSGFSHAQNYLYLNSKDLSQPSRPGNMSESN
ncbi:nudix hydrolase 2-like [Phoenix dactylifera]|uniref:Nudix hydrolase 2-like n=1 Tax=Phoenix dactylifera TaxID=42345 RepID=A0A8B7MV05_PHODC|nr:nudix hydrolase 2-like [Phoenix dactylifera]